MIDQDSNVTVSAKVYEQLGLELQSLRDTIEFLKAEHGSQMLTAKEDSLIILNGAHPWGVLSKGDVLTLEPTEEVKVRRDS